jgi:hypothetical protein
VPNVDIGTSAPKVTNGYGWNPESRVLEIDGSGSSNSFSSGAVVVTNNSPVPRAGDYLGPFLFSSKNSPNGLTAAIGSRLEGAGGPDGFGSRLEFWTHGDNTPGTYTERMRIDANGNVGIGTTAPGNTLQVNGGITVSSCSGCSVLAEMMPVEGRVGEGFAVCVNPDSGKISQCQEDSSLSAVGITTSHAEQILRLGCADSVSKENHLDLGGKDPFFWKKTKACSGWFPVAIGGLQEFVHAECFRSDGSPLRYGDRLVSSGKSPGFVRPLSPHQSGGDALLGKAMSLCQNGEESGVIQVQVVTR